MFTAGKGDVDCVFTRAYVYSQNFPTPMRITTPDNNDSAGVGLRAVVQAEHSVTSHNSVTGHNVGQFYLSNEMHMT